MLRAALFLLLGFPASAADWRASLSSPKPGNFPALPPLRAEYRFGWGAVPAARAQFDFSRTALGEQRLVMTTATSGAVRALWRLDARHDALCRPTTLAPISVEQTETYRDETVRTRATYDAAGVSRTREEIPAGRKAASGPPPKTKRFQCPNVFDLQTALLFMRSQPLRPRESYSFVVYPATGAYLARLEVLGRERIDIGGRTWPAVKLDVKLQSIDKKLVLKPHKKFRKASVWLSDDRDRVLLKANADVFVGSVWVELEKLAVARK